MEGGGGGTSCRLSQEQFLLLAKAARGAALASLIHQVLEAPGIYVFGELLDMPAVRELADSEFSPVFRLLTIFAYGTYADYLAEAANLPPLTEAQKNKLRHLSVVTLAAKIKCIPYSVLLEQLQLKNVRQLEDLVIEAVYADVLRGSLDQRNQRLEVDYSIGRDIRREELSTITRTLQEWCQGCEVVLSGIEEQVSRANQHKEQQLALKQQIESEVSADNSSRCGSHIPRPGATPHGAQGAGPWHQPAPGEQENLQSQRVSRHHRSLERGCWCSAVVLAL
uniref:COP9 signalosome subunit 7A n=1 Tax=Malurus cyaneus samueli TaxID=2593467 RepID=A0A8C5TYH4_9PASS